MEKKRILIPLLSGLFTIAIALVVSACNYQAVDLNYKFTKVHVFATAQCYDISSWKDYENSDQIQVKIKGYGTCLFHSNQVVLIESKCPFCE